MEMFVLPEDWKDKSSWADAGGRLADRFKQKEQNEQDPKTSACFGGAWVVAGLTEAHLT